MIPLTVVQKSTTSVTEGDNRELRLYEDEGSGRSINHILPVVNVSLMIIADLICWSSPLKFYTIVLTADKPTDC